MLSKIIILPHYLHLAGIQPEDISIRTTLSAPVSGALDEAARRAEIIVNQWSFKSIP